MGTHVTPTQRSSRGHMRSLTPDGRDMHKWSLCNLMDFHGIWTKEYWGRGTHLTPTQASKLTLTSSHFANGLPQTVSAKLYCTQFSATRTSALKGL